jgi:hypothetical protein
MFPGSQSRDGFFELAREDSRPESEWPFDLISAGGRETLEFGFRSGGGANDPSYLTGIVVPAGIGTAVTLFFALPVVIRSLYVR